MSNPEDSKIDFEKLTLSPDLSGSLEPLAEDALEQPLSEMQSEAEAKIQEEQAQGAEEGILPETEEVGKLPDSESDLDEAKLEREEVEPVVAQSKFKVLLERLSTADPFNVLLAVTVAALLIAILCCLIELGRYHFDFGAKGAKHTVSVMVTDDFIKNLS